MYSQLRDTTLAVQQLLRTPDPVLPAVAAVTPHKNGRNGITIGEFMIQV